MNARILFGAALMAMSFACKAQDLVVYDDSLENAWQDYSWASVNKSTTGPVHSGSNSISVTDSTSNYEALYLHHAAFNSAGYDSLRFWINPTTAVSDELQVQATLSGTAQTPYTLSFTAAQTGIWQQVTVPLGALGVANSNSFDGFWIQNITGGPLPTFYVDDIRIVASPPPTVVQITVNAGSATRTIDNRIYGTNAVIWDSLLSGTATGAVLSAMQTGAIRIPGGSSSDDYDWQTDRSVSNGSFQWVNNAAGFAKVISNAGSQAFVTVNYGSGTPEQAAAWVAYYNGSASGTLALGVDSKGRNWQTTGFWATIRSSTPLASDDGYNFLRVAHPAPFAIKYWEIGNECYGGWENDLHGHAGSGLGGVAHDPYTYGQAFASYYSRMLAVDPSIRIGAVATPGQDSYGNGTHAAANPNQGNSLHSGWVPVMLTTLKAALVTPHFLIHHSYAQGPGSETDATLLQASGTIISDAANLRQMITDYVGGAAGAGIELDVTEMNSVSSNPGKQTVSLVDGLYMADAIGTLAGTEFNSCVWWALRNGSYAGNNSASLYGARQYGDYGVVSSGDVTGTPANTPYPSFYAAKLLTHWARGGDTLVSATSNYSLLSARAARLANGHLALLVVNKSPASDLASADQSSQVSFPASTDATVYSYGKPNDTAGGDLTTSSVSNVSPLFNAVFPSYSMTVMLLQPSAPGAQTATPTQTTSTGATLNATANANGSDSQLYFQYGSDVTYGQTTPTVDVGSGTSSAPASFALGSLLPGATYHYRVVVTNAGGDYIRQRSEFYNAGRHPRNAGLERCDPRRLPDRRGDTNPQAIRERKLLSSRLGIPAVTLYQPHEPDRIPHRMDFAFLVPVNGADRHSSDLEPTPGRDEQHLRFILIGIARTVEVRRQIPVDHSESALCVRYGLPAEPTDLRGHQAVRHSTGEWHTPRVSHAISQDEARAGGIRRIEKPGDLFREMLPIPIQEHAVEESPGDKFS